MAKTTSAGKDATPGKGASPAPSPAKSKPAAPAPARDAPPPKGASKAAHAVPNYEVKSFLDATKVLDIEFKPTKDIQRALGLASSSLKMAMQFVDARPCRIHPEGWNVRVRKHEDVTDYEVTYKRRYPIGKDGLPGALAAAAEEGFHADEPDYAPQVEWGFAKRTLSFSRKKSFDAPGVSGMNLPGLEVAAPAVIKLLPGKLDRWKKEGWARTHLTAGTLYGPVLGKRWGGKWDGPKLDFEVWLLKTESGQGYEPVVELSFKEDTEDKAGAAREALLALMRKEGWLLERDVMKTEMVLKRY